MLTLFLVYLDDEDDKKVFENMFYSYRKQMVLLATSILHNQDDAEDVVHDVFLRIVTKNMDVVRKINHNTDLRNYVLKATKNAALNMAKKKRHENISIHNFEENLIKENDNLTDERFLEVICNRSEYERVVGAIKSLEEKYRDVLYYHFVLELTVNETAKLLGQTVSATKKQLVRGKKLLLNLLGIVRSYENGNK